MTHSTSRLLIIWHSRTGASMALAKAAALGCGQSAQIKRAEDVSAQDMLGAGGYLFVCPENLAGLSGMMKEMFDRLYYPVLGRIEGRPYASIIAAGSDGEGAERQLERIVTGWRLKRVMEGVIMRFDADTPETILAAKHPSEDMLESSRAIGEAMAEGLAQGIF